MALHLCVKWHGNFSSFLCNDLCVRWWLLATRLAEMIDVSMIKVRTETCKALTSVIAMLILCWAMWLRSFEQRMGKRLECFFQNRTHCATHTVFHAKEPKTQLSQEPEHSRTFIFPRPLENSCSMGDALSLGFVQVRVAGRLLQDWQKWLTPRRVTCVTIVNILDHC